MADEPPASLVQKLAANFTATGGDLREFTRTLIRSDEFWRRDAYQAKFKTPYQYLLSSLRALDLPLGNPQNLLSALSQAGQQLKGPDDEEGREIAVVLATPRSPEAEAAAKKRVADRAGGYSHPCPRPPSGWCCGGV